MHRIITATMAFPSATFHRHTESRANRSTGVPPGLPRRLLLAALVAAGMFVFAAQDLYASVPYGRLWATTWNLGSSNDRGQSIATDSAGNVYVVGFDLQAYYLRKYSPAGAEIWTRIVVNTSSLFLQGFINGFVVVDGSDNPIVGGTMNANDGTSLDYFVAKYDPAGTQLWLRRFDANNDHDSLTALAVDTAGNVYAHGHGNGSGPRNVYTVKWDPDGARSWVATYTSADDLGCDVAVHTDGSVYVLASTTGYATDDDIILIKYNAAGGQEWLRRYNGGGASGWTDDWPAKLRLDGDGNPYLVGYSEISDGGGYGVVTQKYLADGTLVWTRRYDLGFPSSGDYGHKPAGLAIDGSGNVYVSGQILTLGSTGVDVVTIKYASDGTPLWSRMYAGTTAYADEPRDLVLTPDGSVFVLAMTSLGPSTSDHRVALLRYDIDGTLLSSPVDSESSEGYMLARRGAAVHYVGTSRGYDVTVRKYAPIPSMSINDVFVTEGQGNTTNATFTVSLSEASEGTVTVDYQTANGTATAAGGGETNAANTASIAIPSSGAATPYPSGITVPGGLGSLDKVKVTLTGFSHTWPNDVDVLLVGPGGQSVVLMSDVGSSADAVDLTFVFDDTGPALGTGTLVSGTYRPTDLSPADSWPAPAPAGPYGTALSVFNGTDPAGTWKLYVVDDTAGDFGSFAGGWSLTLTTPIQTGGDYVPASGTLSIPAGATSGTVTVTVFGDTAVEPAETFFVNLSNPTNAAISDGQGIGTINNDDGIRGDFTGDQKADILWRHATLGQLWLWPMDGTSRTAESFVRTVADLNWEIRGVADFTGDGKADILWRNKTNGQMYLWPMDGHTPLSETYVAMVDPAYDIVGTGDFNGDGKSDILWRHTTLGDVWIWLMDGATPLSQVYVDTVDPGYAVVGSGDLNGDTKADLLWHHGTRGEVWVWLMNGTTRTSQTYVGTVGDVGYKIVGVADHTGDGKADILWHHATRGEVWVWLMNGTTKLSETWVATVPDVGYEIVKVK
jgi:subtilisin-like proprotein convertase family protein